MFDFWVFAIGAIASILLAALKIAGVVAFSWLLVSVPVIVGVLFVLVRHGLDVFDLLPD